MKRIVYACLEEMLHFDAKDEYNIFAEHLGKPPRPKKYKIEDVQYNSDGSVNVLIKRQYANTSFDEYLK